VQSAARSQQPAAPNPPTATTTPPSSQREEEEEEEEEEEGGRRSGWRTEEAKGPLRSLADTHSPHSDTGSTNNLRRYSSSHHAPKLINRAKDAPHTYGAQSRSHLQGERLMRLQAAPPGRASARQLRPARPVIVQIGLDF
jgi:hypothetical protein